MGELEGGAWLWALRVALLAALVQAWQLARRHPTYRPVALFLSWAALAHVVRPLLQVFILAAARAAGRVPYVGLERVAYHIGEQALFVAWPFGIAALALWTFRRIHPRVAAVVWIAVVAGLALAYPNLRGENLARAYCAITVAALLVGIGVTVAWWFRRTRPQPPEIAAMLFIAGEVGVVILGPYAVGHVREYWPVSQGLYTGLYATLFALEVAWSRRR